ncbi:MAG: polysialyltransferase family glycosyltransferase [Thiomicrorhabdus chilensis]|uniref:polysialyltransferase family glycosyltransferase n=1 Tax=Thiomicrorhabdus chilensis TaxID=63656 RepID=UPI00299F4F44|nr:polysialyltransferase family glycosyltransferase [Thiomicrorhabdus chilensis]MDX1347267.1 polysialyltransferase family glycosyltransferase [Thiomicrorhabdus chilensis]
MTDVQSRNVLYLPSTPLNILVSVAHAEAYASEQKSRLILIDQKSEQDNPYFNVLKKWRNSPFENVNLILGTAQGKQKLKERKANFVKLVGLIKDFKVDAIAVGSDRRVEFQYLMHQCTKKNTEVEGWYLDDGLYSYSGRRPSWWKDGLNKQLKKVFYGDWWQEPKTVGASDWIRQVWLFRPRQAVTELKSKIMNPLKPQWFISPGVREFSQKVCEAYNFRSEMLTRLQSIDLFLLIPHPNNIKKMQGYEPRIQQFLTQMQKKGVQVATKYHPRTETADPLQLQEKYQALLIPSGLAFEFVLPFLKNEALVVGDVGTALLTAQWLRSDLRVSAVLASEDEFQNTFKALYLQLGVNIAEDFNEISMPSVLTSGKGK